MSSRILPADDATDGDNRSRILSAATCLVASGGADAATIRAVAAVASVQAPAIYRLFGDKDGLLNAVAENAFAEYVENKSRRQLTDDPLNDLRRDWDSHVTFGLSHPEVFALMHVNRRTPPSSAWTAGVALVTGSVRRVARTGRLRVSEERAVDLIDASVTGTVLTLGRKAPEQRAGLCEAARDALFGAIFDLGDRPPAQDHVGAASAVRASLDQVPGLTRGERILLDELLQRIAEGSTA